MALAVTFDGAARLMILGAGTTALSVKDLWSEWVRWLPQGDNSKYLPAFRAQGGDLINLSNGSYIPTYIFLVNGWKIRPQEADHNLDVTEGVLIVDGAGPPFVPTLGDFTVQVNYQQPVQSISLGVGAVPTATQVADAVWAKMLASGITAELEMIAARQAAQNAFAVSA